MVVFAAYIIIAIKMLQYKHNVKRDMCVDWLSSGVTSGRWCKCGRLQRFSQIITDSLVGWHCRLVQQCVFGQVKLPMKRVTSGLRDGLDIVANFCFRTNRGRDEVRSEGFMLLRGFGHSLKKIVIVMAVSVVPLTLWLYVQLPDWAEVQDTRKRLASKAIVDRNGRLIRLLPDDKGTFCLWCPIERVPTRARQAVISAEDKRFYYHPGVDPLAVLRAVAQNLRRGKVHSGASTISQQVVRLVNPRPRSLRSKIVEALESMKMEWQLSKDQVLELYVNLSPMGGNIRGMGLASRTYFGKDVAHISLPEAAILAAVPRSPSRLNPGSAKGRERLPAQKDRILARMCRQGLLSADDAAKMERAPVKFRLSSMPLEAPHVVDLVSARGPDKDNRVRTTVDLDIQHLVERALHSHRSRLARLHIRQVAAVVVSVNHAETLAMVGSLAYAPGHRGFCNGVLAHRGLGSTLKPFLYALALESGLTAASEVPDTFQTYPTPHGDYLPFNADRRNYGPVTIRLALGNSLNLPAVKTLQHLGVPRFYDLLGTLDLVGPRSPDAEHFGLGLAIGNLESSLFRLVQAYTALARGGVFRPVVLTADEKAADRRVFSPEVAYIIGNILSDPNSRLLTFGNPAWQDFGFPMAIKTGTSTNHRDCWVIGYTARHIIGLWAGNFDGAPGDTASGSRTCGPILHDIACRLYGRGNPAVFARPKTIKDVSLCWLSGKRAAPTCPHVFTELFAGDPPDPATCTMIHSADEHLYLGSPYASWLDRRQLFQGVSRFRLAGPGQGPPATQGASAFTGQTFQSADSPSGSISHSSSIKIVSPNDSDRFVMSPNQPDRIRLRAVPALAVPHVMWLVDGVEAARTPSPYEFLWKPYRGRHRILAVTPDSGADAISISVE